MREVERLLREHGAIEARHVELSSGLHSDTYVQCARLLQYPDWAEELGRAIAEEWDEVDVVASPAVGAIIIGHEVARALSVRFVFAEKTHAGFELRRGIAIRPGERVLVVDNVVTTGRSALQVARLVSASGGVVAGIAAIVDRSTTQTVMVHALTRVRAAMWPAAQCPVCQRLGSEPVDSGGDHG